MRRTHDDGKAVCNHSVLGNAVKCHRRIVHGRTQIVGLEAEQQFANLSVSPGTEVTHFFLEVSLRPTVETPVFIIDENTSVLHSRLFRYIFIYFQV